MIAIQNFPLPILLLMRQILMVELTVLGPDSEKYVRKEMEYEYKINA